MLVYRNVMSEFSRQSSLVNLGEFNSPKGLFCTPNVECVSNMVRWSYDQAQCGYEKLGAGYLMVIDAQEYHSPLNSEKVNHWDVTDKEELVVTKGEVIKVVKLSIYDTVEDIEQKIASEGLTALMIEDIITTVAKEKEERIEQEKRQQSLKQLEEELEAHGYSLGWGKGWVITSNEGGWARAQDLEEREWTYINGRSFKVHKVTGEIYINEYIYSYSEYKSLVSKFKQYLAIHDHSITLWYGGYISSWSFRKILDKRFPYIRHD